ncbi:MAG: hypothetical protein CFE24_00970 [Flavobacterium sp. BFFFF2]|nr:MAG: hypothetical protein CFE24_00970 [Flavobacterium sp. BFFFF2]
MKKHVFVWSLIVMSCTTKIDYTETQDSLPPITQVGANTAGCLIDGIVLVPNDSDYRNLNSSYHGLRLSQGLSFWPNKNDYWQLKIINRTGSVFYFMGLWIKNMSSGNGMYPIDQSNGAAYPNCNIISVEITANGTYKKYCSGPNSGIIKIDRSDLGPGISIYSGTFQCTLYNRDKPSETIQITDGRFDIDGLTLNL